MKKIKEKKDNNIKKFIWLIGFAIFGFIILIILYKNYLLTDQYNIIIPSYISTITVFLYIKFLEIIKNSIFHFFTALIIIIGIYIYYNANINNNTDDNIFFFTIAISLVITIIFDFIEKFIKK